MPWAEHVHSGEAARGYITWIHSGGGGDGDDRGNESNPVEERETSGGRIVWLERRGVRTAERIEKSCCRVEKVACVRASDQRYGG